MWHPLLNESGVLSQFKEVCQRVTEEVIVPNYARRVPGKEVMLSLHPVPPQEVRDIFRMVEEIIAKNQLVVSVTRSASAIDITPKGIDKAAGVQWLIDTLKEPFSVKLADIAGIGDSAGDIAFLRIVGFSAAPANASESVKDRVNYSSSSADGQGVVDIIRQCINANMHAGSAIHSLCAKENWKG